MPELIERMCPSCGAPVPAGATITCPFCEASLTEKQPERVVEIVREIHTREIVREVVRDVVREVVRDPEDYEVAPVDPADALEAEVEAEEEQRAFRWRTVVGVVAAVLFLAGVIAATWSAYGGGARDAPVVVPTAASVSGSAHLQSYEEAFGAPPPNDPNGLHVERRGARCVTVLTTPASGAIPARSVEMSEVPCPSGL